MKLNVSFLWHFHQPYYVDPESGNMLLPWVRLHGVKDYAYLAELFEAFPGITHTVNFVPSLLKQIELLADGKSVDRAFVLSEKDPFQLTEEEKCFILDHFFNAHPDTMIALFPRYVELFKLFHQGGSGRQDLLSRFGASEIQDLQVLFNLAWINPGLYEGNENISSIARKGRGFTKEEKSQVLAFHREIISSITGRYRNLQDSGIIDVTFSPFYHPILPLLIDSNVAGEADPSLDRPDFRFSFPQDASQQIKDALVYMRTLFSKELKGMWPSEGSVSLESLMLTSSHGITHTFTDEIVLQGSTGEKIIRNIDGVPLAPEILYQPYQIKGTELKVFFRDHYLSDLIGFTYKGWDPDDGARHFVEKLSIIRDTLILKGYNPEKFIVSIIIDGENPWEYYKYYGNIFLNSLFTRLNKSKELHICTFNEYLLRQEGKKFPILNNVKPGSWIDGTFKIWFSHKEDFRAWNEVLKFRNILEHKSIKKKVDESILRLIHIVEGSDWYWWYGDEHFTADLDLFDLLFRNNLKAAYRGLGLEVPDSLNKPLIDEKRLKIMRKTGEIELKPTSFITPLIDGLETNYFEWTGSARYTQGSSLSSMHKEAHPVIRGIYTGFDRNNIYLRIDFSDETISDQSSLYLSISLNKHILDIKIDLYDNSISIFGKEKEYWENIEISYDVILELSIPYHKILKENYHLIKLYLSVKKNSGDEERWPHFSTLSMGIPKEDPSLSEWLI